MKILHIATSTGGGAGISAIRLHRGLIELGIQSKLLCLNNELIDDEIYTIPHHQDPVYLRALNLLFPSTRSARQQRLLRKLGGEYEIYSFPNSSYKLEEHPLVKEADIINFHWISRMIDLPSFLSHVKKPIVWTLHDMNPFQGGFHYSLDEKKNERRFSSLEERIREVKKRAYSESSIKAIVTPSVWLQEESKKSGFFGEISHYHVPYGIPTSVFKPFEKESARQILQLPPNKKILLFVSESVTSRRKGFSTILHAAKKYADNESLFFLAVGKPPEEKVDCINYFGPIKDQHLLPLAYSAADIFLLPSLEDNLPNVMLESLCCGTPVVGYPIGGVSENVFSGLNGQIAQEVSEEAYIAAIDTMLDYSLTSSDISKEAHSNFYLQRQAADYQNIYRNLL